MGFGIGKGGWEEKKYLGKVAWHPLTNKKTINKLDN